MGGVHHRCHLVAEILVGDGVGEALFVADGEDAHPVRRAHHHVLAQEEQQARRAGDGDEHGGDEPDGGESTAAHEGAAG